MQSIYERDQFVKSLLVKASPEIFLQEIPIFQEPMENSDTQTDCTPHRVSGCPFKLERIDDSVPSLFRNTNHYPCAKAVYRVASMAAADMTSNVSYTAKVAYTTEAIENLEKERQVYCCSLEKLQGTTVPIFYGFYRTEGTTPSAAIMILEDCGDTLKRELAQYPPKIRTAVLQSLAEIHKMGVSHDDPEERNIILRKDGRAVFIDFEHADTGHTCHFDTTEFSRETWPPRNCPVLLHTSGCRELFQAAESAQIWFPEILFWHNVRVQKEWLDHGDAELAQFAWAATKESEEKYDMSSIDARIERVREEYAEWRKNREEWDTEGVELK